MDFDFYIHLQPGKYIFQINIIYKKMWVEIYISDKTNYNLNIVHIYSIITNAIR